MLESVKIARRQSEIREKLAALAGNATPDENEVRSMEALDKEYQTNETRYRAALVAEDTERREAGAELETRSGNEWNGLIDQFEMRQVALALDEGKALEGATAEVVQELRNAGGYRGLPVPWEALEIRAGETVAAGTPAPVTTRPIIDRLFPASVAARMGGQMVNVGTGSTEWPVTSSSVSAGWADGETGSVANPTAYTTADRSLSPDHTLGIQMKLTRKALKQSGAAIEQAVRRDMQGAIASEMDKAVFLGAGATGQPLGLIPGAATYGLNATTVTAAADWAKVRAAVVRFMTANAANSASDVNILLRPEIYDAMDGAYITNTAVTEWDRMIAAMGGVYTTSNSLAAPDGSQNTTAVLTTSAGGVAPFFIGTWGAVDLIRDPYSDAATGGLRVTALATMDVTVSRAEQIEILEEVQA